MKERPTVQELEALLERKDLAVEIQPNGEVRAVPERDRIATQRDEARGLAIELRDALQAIYDECSELSDINHVGTHENHNMRRARAALRRAIMVGSGMWPPP